MMAHLFRCSHLFPGVPGNTSPSGVPVPLPIGNGNGNAPETLIRQGQSVPIAGFAATGRSQAGFCHG